MMNKLDLGVRVAYEYFGAVLSTETSVFTINSGIAKHYVPHKSFGTDDKSYYLYNGYFHTGVIWRISEATKHTQLLIQTSDE
jgi:hypothetical protein